MDKLQFLFRNYPEIRTREVAQMVEHLPENVKSCVQSPVLKKKKRKEICVCGYLLFWEEGWEPSFRSTRGQDCERTVHRLKNHLWSILLVLVLR
jgi:hypothetical protein